MNQIDFLNELKRYRRTHVFNPYRDVCDIYDKSNAPAIRLNNLKLTLDYFSKHGADSIWIGRDLGYKGGRRTGLALTDEAHLSCASKMWGVNLKQATRGEQFSERTAKNIWQILNSINENIFMWNVFPFHPHEIDEHFSNRSHTKTERDDGEEILKEIVFMLKPKRIIAIGNDAFNSSTRIFQSQSIFKVRHPSYGGEKQFKRDLSKIYEFQFD